MDNSKSKIEKRLLEKIKSNLTLKLIFEYIEDNKIKLKLFNYSKFFQNKLDLQLDDYIDQYMSKYTNKIELHKYLSRDHYKYDYDKNILKKNFEAELSENKIDKEMIQQYAVNYFRKSKVFNYNITIYSPFFESLSKTKFFEKKFFIKIPTNKIENLNLKKDYIDTFNKLNKLNKRYSLRIENIYRDHTNYFEKYNIKSNKIHKLAISIGYYYKDHLKDLLSSDFKNLTYLEMKIEGNEIYSVSFENIINASSLEYLNLTNFKFKDNLNLNLNKLKNLELSNCENITLTGDCCSNIRKLVLYEPIMISSNSLLTFSKLEEFEYYCTNNKIMHQIVDFSTSKKIKKFTCNNLFYFIYLFQSSCLEKLKFISLKHNSSLELEKKLLKKIFSIKTLKEVYFQLYQLDDYNISEIVGENTTIDKLIINCNNQISKIDILQNKFPNLTDFSLILPNDNNSSATNLKIKENINCKIIQLFLNNLGNINLNIKSFEDLVKIIIIQTTEIINIQKVFPFFSDKLEVKFKSLIELNYSFLYNGNKINILNNFYNNIDKMPNLEKIMLIFYSKDINENFYEKLIKKLLLLKIILICIYFDKPSLYYTYEELELLCPNIKFKDFNNIRIQKLN